MSDPAKHSPGPWKADKGHEDESERWTVIADNGTQPYLIAVIENGQPGDTMETEEATARLIAAAPEMLSMLYRVHGGCLTKETEDLVWDLILKAEGRDAS